MKKFWFPILLLMVLIASLLACIYWVFWASANKMDLVGAVVATVIIALILIIYLIVWPTCYSSAIEQVAKMRAFFESTQKAYKYAIETTQEIEIKTLKGKKPSLQEIKIGNMKFAVDLGDLTYLKLGREVSDRVYELRREVEWYNAKLEAYRRWNKISIARGFIPDVPDDLDFITL